MKTSTFRSFLYGSAILLVASSCLYADITIQNRTKSTLLHKSRSGLLDLRCTKFVRNDDTMVHVGAPCNGDLANLLNRVFAPSVGDDNDLEAGPEQPLWYLNLTPAQFSNTGSVSQDEWSWTGRLRVAISVVGADGNRVDQRWIQLQLSGSVRTMMEVAQCTTASDPSDTKGVTCESGEFAPGLRVELTSSGSSRDRNQQFVLKITGDSRSAAPNLAFGKQARQSSTALGGEAGRAIDGITDGNWSRGSVTHTDTQKAPYWEVDLGEVVDVTRVRVFNRVDCCAERLTNVWVFFSSQPFTTVGVRETYAEAWRPGSGVTYKTHPETVRESADFVLNQKSGARYVRVQLEGEGILSLAEVMVFSH